MPARLTFKLEARVAHDPVPFDAFVEWTTSVASLLAQLDLSESNEPSVRWVVEDLKIGSATVAIKAEPLNPLFDRSQLVADRLTRGLARVASEGSRPADFSETAWDDARRMFRVLEGGLSRVAIDSGSEHVDLTEAAAARIEPDEEAAAARPEAQAQQAIATIEGTLETASVHGQRLFSLWDVLYHRRVKCEFPAAVFDDVKAGFGERVRVHGRVAFDRFGHPVKITEITAVSVLYASRPRPRPADLRGLVPNMTQGLPADVWVRQIRDA